MNVHRCLAAMLLLLFVWALGHAATTQYYYDDLGRVVQALRSDGAVFQYQYDANGNVLAINRIVASTLSISGFAPSIGHAGTSVNIFGTGFSATPANNQVRFGAVTATVSAATSTRLTVTVPLGAVTAPITVSVAGTATTSAMNYVVRLPGILSFSPAAAAPGAPVTITGVNLNLVPGQTTVSVGSTPVTVVSVTNTQVVFNTPAQGSALVHVNTPYGNISTASKLIIVPPAVGAANVVTSAEIVAGDPGGENLSLPQAGKYGLFVFEAVQDQYLTVSLTQRVGTPSNTSISFVLYSPSHSVLLTGTFGTNQRTLFLPKIPATGAYVLSLRPNSGTVQLTARLEVDQMVPVDSGTLTSTTDIAGAPKRVIFAATAGDNLGLAITGQTSSVPGNVSYGVNGPAGQFACITAASPGCQQELPNLPYTGTYTIIAAPAASTATMGFTLRLTRHTSGTLQIGTPQTLNLGSGQYADLTFTAAAGQSLAVDVTSLTSVPAGKAVRMQAYAENGTGLGQALSSTWPSLTLTALPAGTHRVRVFTHDAATASMQFRLASADVGVVPIDNGTVSFTSTLPGQSGVATFTATAGDSLGLAVTNVTSTPFTNIVFTIYAPNGGTSGSVGCDMADSPGCQVELPNLPLTGTYRIVAAPNVVAAMGFTLRLTRHATGTLSIGTPQTLNLAPGQYANFTFTAAANQSLAVSATSIVSTPAGKPVRLQIFAPNGTSMGSTLTSTWPSLTVTAATAGTYRLYLLERDAAPASMELTLGSADVGTVPIDSGTVSFTSTAFGQSGIATFSAAAGDDVGLAVTNVSMSPTGTVVFTMYGPTGTLIGTLNCSSAASPGCQHELRNVPLTGTYRIVSTPSMAATIGYTLRLSRHVTDPLVVGTPYSLSLQPGQYTLLTFNATAGQARSVSASSIATTPAGKQIGLRVYAPAGNQVGQSFSTTAPSVTVSNPVTGTYTVLFFSADAAPATMGVTLQ
jgi:YD repeat-containing protein